MAKIKKWLDNNDDRTGCGGKPLISNITDNESAKMKTSKRVIQGYVGVASVDRKTQMIVSAEAFGQGQDLLLPSVNGIREDISIIRHDGDVLAKAKVTADSGCHSGKNMEVLFSANIDAYVADPHFRKRDPRFTTAPRHKEKESAKPIKGKLFTSADFTYSRRFQQLRLPCRQPSVP